MKDKRNLTVDILKKMLNEEEKCKNLTNEDKTHWFHVVRIESLRHAIDVLNGEENGKYHAY